MHVTEAKVLEFAEKNLDSLVELIKEAIENLLPNYQDAISVEVEGRGHADVCVIVRNTQFSFTVGEEDKSTIIGEKHFPAWELNGTKYFAATHWEPEDCDVFPISVHQNNTQAVAAFIRGLFADEVECWSASVSEREYEESLKNDLPY